MGSSEPPVLSAIVANWKLAGSLYISRFVQGLGPSATSILRSGVRQPRRQRREARMRARRTGFIVGSFSIELDIDE